MSKHSRVYCSKCGKEETGRYQHESACCGAILFGGGQSDVVADLKHILHQYQFAAAEFAGTNSAIDIDRQAGLFRKYREIFQDLQREHHDIIKITEKKA